MTLLRSLLILMVLALSPAHVAADGPPGHGGAQMDMHAIAQVQEALADCCDSGAHQASCQLQTPLPEGMALAAPRAVARQMLGAPAPECHHGRDPERALRPPILI